MEKIIKFLRTFTYKIKFHQMIEAQIMELIELIVVSELNYVK